MKTPPACYLRPEVEQMANQLGVQTLVSPAMCGDIGDLFAMGWEGYNGVGQLGVQGAGRPVFFVCFV